MGKATRLLYGIVVLQLFRIVLRQNWYIFYVLFITGEWFSTRNRFLKSSKCYPRQMLKLIAILIFINVTFVQTVLPFNAPFYLALEELNIFCILGIELVLGFIGDWCGEFLEIEIQWTLSKADNLGTSSSCLPYGGVRLKEGYVREKQVKFGLDKPSQPCPP